MEKHRKELGRNVRLGFIVSRGVVINFFIFIFIVTRCVFVQFQCAKSYRGKLHKPKGFCFCQILEALESDDENDEQEVVPSVDATYDHPEHVVTVTTVSDVNLDSGKFACIGPNRVSDRCCGIVFYLLCAGTLTSI